MRHKFLLFLLLLAISTPNHTKAAGGPDAFGYIWTTSIDSGGPIYNWIDISTSGTPIINLTDDNVTEALNIGWSFHYYWDDFTQVRVGSNGFMRVGTQPNNITSCFPTVPTVGGSAGDNILAVFMTDLTFLGAANYGRAYYWSNNVDSFIVTWDSVPYWVNSNPDFQGYRTFQVILNGADSSILYQYKGTDGTFTNNANCLADIEIGIENLTGSIGLEVFNETLPQNNFAVLFHFPGAPLMGNADHFPLSQNANLEIYPNPAQDRITVTYENRLGADVNFTITDLYGQQVFSHSQKGLGVGTFNFPINTAGLASGVYFLNMEAGTEKITKKLIVSH